MLVDSLPFPEPPKKWGRGRPREYSDRLIVKALVIMIIRRLYSAYSLLAFLEQETALTCQLRELLTENGRFPTRRTWERRLVSLPDSLPGLIGCFGRYLVALLRPYDKCGQAVAMDSSVPKAVFGIKSIVTRVLYPIARLTPMLIGQNRAITGGGTDGNCI